MCRTHSLMVFCVLASCVMLWQQIAAADETKTAKAVAPLNTEVFETSFEGAWFVDKQLKTKYEAAKTRLEELENEIRSGKLERENGEIAISDARLELQNVRQGIDRLRTIYDRQMVMARPEAASAAMPNSHCLCPRARRCCFKAAKSAQTSPVLMAN